MQDNTTSIFNKNVRLLVICSAVAVLALVLFGINSRAYDATDKNSPTGATTKNMTTNGSAKPDTSNVYITNGSIAVDKGVSLAEFTELQSTLSELRKNGVLVSGSNSYEIDASSVINTEQKATFKLHPSDSSTVTSVGLERIQYNIVRVTVQDSSGATVFSGERKLNKML